MSRRTEPPHLIFSEPRDYEEFGIFLARILTRTETELVGYCCMPDAVHLLLTVHFTPVGEVMQRVTQYCAQNIRKRTGAQANFIGNRPIVLTHPKSHLPILLRYIHYIPVVAGVAATLSDYPYSSHPVYAGKTRCIAVPATVLQNLIRVPRLH